ncbi:HAMP domain-containing protein, partial [Granulosicoccus sp.]|nr:HAMP domain-containing protein [Granulosicoccus sp.]
MILVATIGAGWALDQLFARFGDNGPDQSGDNTALTTWRELGRTLADVLDQTDDPASIIEQLDLHRAENSFNSVRLLDRVELAVSGDGTNTLDEAMDSPTGLALESDLGVTVYFALADGTTLLALEYPMSTGATTGIRLLLTFVFYLALVLLVMAWLLPLLRRLTRLTNTAWMFGRGDLSQRVPTRSRSDLHTLESTFNAMASRIENLVEDNRLLSRGVAHDLRTPLARLRFGIDSMVELDPEAPDSHK